MVHGVRVNQNRNKPVGRPRLVLNTNPLFIPLDGQLTGYLGNQGVAFRIAPENRGWNRGRERSVHWDFL